jgi:hypothetical protein
MFWLFPVSLELLTRSSESVAIIRLMVSFNFGTEIFITRGTARYLQLSVKAYRWLIIGYLAVYATYGLSNLNPLIHTLCCTPLIP